MENNANYKSGFVALIGRPNVGKSTLMNHLIGQKIAITSKKPQTTRNRICAVVNREGCQFVFLDTPGLHKARTRLGDYMVKVVKESVADVDAVMLLVEPIPNVGGPEAELIARIKTLGCPSVLVINKVDTLEHKEELLEVIQTYGQAHEFTAVVPVSARTGEGVEELLDVLDGFLPQGPQLFPEDMVTDQPERQMMAEILREKLLLCLEIFPPGTGLMAAGPVGTTGTLTGKHGDIPPYLYLSLGSTATPTSASVHLSALSSLHI